MSRRARTAGRIGAFVALVFLMTGCIKLNMNLGINSDDTVSGTVEFGVQKELLDLTGQNIEDLLGSDAPFPSNAPGVTVEPFDDGEFAGQQFIFEDVPLEEFNSGGVVGASGATGASGGAADTLQIARQGDTFVVTGVLDLSTGLSGVTGPFGGTGGAEFFESADIKIAITFPGEVLQAPGGEIDGNTVTYVPEFGERLEINATGSAVDNGEAADVVGGSDSFLPLILIIAGVVLVLLIVLFLVVRGRRHEDGGGTPSGFGEEGSAAAPVAAPPGAPTDSPPPAPPMPPAAPPPPPPPAES
jgi:LppM domain